MVLNVVFLVGGMFVGYLIRGEVNRRKTKKVVSELLDVASNIIETLNNKEENEDETEMEKVSDNIINISNDETIKL